MKYSYTTNSPTVIGSIFTFIGLIACVIVAHIYLSHQNFLSQAIITQGIVVENIASDSGTYTPRIEFTTLDNQSISFLTSGSSKPPRFSVGEYVDVAYPANAPEQAKVKELEPALIIFAVVGILVSTIGLLMLFFGIRKKIRKKNVARTGIKISAQVLSVARNTGVSFNGTHPYVIQAQYHDPQTHTVYSYTSDSIWFDPSGFLSQNIDVFVDPQDFSHYHVDISFLPASG